VFEEKIFISDYMEGATRALSALPFLGLAALPGELPKTW